MNIVIIEDELKAARELQFLIEEMDPGYKVCKILQSVDESVDWFRKNGMPHLIFCDIELADGSCFEIFAAMAITAPVIFCTAYDQYALRAFENNGIDYIVKPVEREKLAKSFQKIDRMRYLNIRDEAEERLSKLSDSFKSTYKTHLYVYSGSHVVSVKVSDIDFIYTYNNNALIYTAGRPYEIKATLDNLMLDLDPHLFVRANRQYIICRHSIDQVHHVEARKLLVTLRVQAPEKIIISKSKSPRFLKWMTQNETHPLLSK